jgi:HSP20 family molecular chaperone IbpA
MMDEMDRMFERTVGDLEEIGHMVSLDDGWEHLVAMPSFDVLDRGSAYHVRFSIPDGNVQSTELTLEGRVLTIGIASPSQLRRNAALVRYNRQILLPGPVAEAADAQAFVTNGLLYVVVPKALGSASGNEVARPVRVF